MNIRKTKGISRIYIEKGVSVLIVFRKNRENMAINIHRWGKTMMCVKSAAKSGGRRCCNSCGCRAALPSYQSTQLSAQGRAG